jgi:FkbM family methyltransferase
MNSLTSLKQAFPSQVNKPSYIQRMYEEHHYKLFEYQELLKNTNVKSIEINNDEIVITTKDRGLRLVLVKLDRRIATVAMLNFDDYEKEETNMIHKLVRNGDTILDIGANIGWHSLNLALAKRDCQIHAFEPIPTTFSYLVRNIELNAISNISIHNFGFSDKQGEFDFYYYPEGSGNASLANLSGRDSVIKIPCKLSTVDDYVQQVNLKVDFIKCDVEGAELFVFKGGAEMIKRDKPIVFSEILRKWSANFNYDANAIFQLFFDFGYSAYTINRGMLKPFREMDENTVDTNFILIHETRLDSLSLIE